MRKYALIATPLILILTSGCWYGTFMSPRPVGTGKVRIRAIGNFPAYLNGHDRDKDNTPKPAGDPAGDDEITPGFGSYFAKGMLTYGAGERFDIGLQGNMYSVGIHTMWWAAVRPETSKKGMDFSPILFLDYIFETQRIAPKLSLVGGIPLSRIAEAYIGYEGFYGPDMTFIDDVYAGRVPFKKIPQEIYQDDIFLGVDFNFQDIGFTAEFGYPITRNDHNKSSTIWFGLGAYYGALLEGLL